MKYAARPRIANILGALYHADFDAADPGVVLAGSVVTSVPNRGLDGAAMVGTGTQKPLFVASVAAFANGPGLQFDGVDDAMTCVLNTPIPAARRPMSWVVVQPLTSGGDQVPGSMLTATGGRFLVSWTTRAGSGKFEVGAQTASVTFGSGLDGTADLTRSHLVEVADTVNGIAALRVDGGAGVDGLPTGGFGPISQSFTHLSIGHHNGTQKATCIIRRFIVANDLPSPGQMNAVRAYLQGSYGLRF